MSEMSELPLQTISIASVPPTLLNSQGSILDPVQIKKSSAAKMRLADKTGNVALRKEAAAEQSFADRLGGRTALLSDELKAQIEQQKLAQADPNTPSPASPTPETAESEDNKPQESEQKKGRKRGAKKQAEQTAPQEETEEQDQTHTPRQHQPLKPTSEPFTPQKQAPVVQPVTFVPQITLPPEAIILKLDAASKQSIADKTGNLVLKRTAALEQSLADKMAFVSAPGITTTALRAGRKGFMLDPNFQLQTNAIVSAVTAAAAAAIKTVPQQQPQVVAQQPKQPKQKRQDQPQVQTKDNETMVRSVSFAGVKPQQTNDTMARSKSFKQPKPAQDKKLTEQPFYLKPKKEQPTTTAPQRSDSNDWRVKDQTETMVRSSSFGGFKQQNNDSMVRSSSFASQKQRTTETQTSPDPENRRPRTQSPISSSMTASTSTSSVPKYIPPAKLAATNGEAQTMTRSKSFGSQKQRDAADQYRAKNNKGDDTPSVDIEKFKDGASVVDRVQPAINPLTPATACM